jgi:hypothetical protein
MGVAFGAKAATSDPLRLACAPSELSDTTIIDFGINVDLSGQVCRLHRRWQLPVARRDYESVHLYCFLVSVCFVSPLSVSIAPHVMSCFRADSRLSARPNCTRCHWHHVSTRLLGCVASCVLRKCITASLGSVGSVGVAPESLFRTKQTMPVFIPGPPVDS